MPDAQEQDDAQLIQVQVSSRAVHKAVQNIIKNELKVDALTIRDAVMAKAEEVAQAAVLAFLDKGPWDVGGLQNRIEDRIKRISDAGLKDIVREVVTRLVHEEIHDQVIKVIEVIVKDGLKIRLNWNRDIKVKVEAAEPPG